MNRVCLAKIGESWEKAELMGVYQHSEIVHPSLMVGGHGGGVIAAPMAVVIYDGKRYELNVNKVKNII